MKVKNCTNKWTYENLTQKKELRVLLFCKKSHYDISSYPNFIIGTADNSDTIAIIDKDFSGDISRNSKITVSPATWTILEKKYINPLFTVYANSKDNDLNCHVKTVYYGKIDSTQ